MSAIRRTVYLPEDEPAALPLVDEPVEVAEHDPYWVYDTREPLVFDDDPIHVRHIGVLASRPFHHRGLNASYVDVSRTTVRVNTATYGNGYPAADADAQIQLATEHTIEDLDRAIAELIRHRDRLTAELREDRKAVDR